MSLTYPTYIAELAKLAQTSPSEPNFVALLPGTIDYAELRIQRDLQLARTVTRDSSTTVTANSPNYTAPSAFIVVQGLNLITPVATQPDAGTRTSLRVVSLDFLDVVWPTRAVQASPDNVPIYAAPVTDLTFVLAPTPDAAYVMEVVGTQRITPLSAAAPTNFLISSMPDLYIAASMVFIAGFQRNWSASGDDPSMAVNWENTYQKTIAGCDKEELMKRYQSQGWTAQEPVTVAAQPRG